MEDSNGTTLSVSMDKTAEKPQAGLVVGTCNPSTEKAEAGVSEFRTVRQNSEVHLNTAQSCPQRTKQQQQQKPGRDTGKELALQTQGGRSLFGLYGFDWLIGFVDLVWVLVLIQGLAT